MGQLFVLMSFAGCAKQAGRSCAENVVNGKLDGVHPLNVVSSSALRGAYSMSLHIPSFQAREI